MFCDNKRVGSSENIPKVNVYTCCNSTSKIHEGEKKELMEKQKILQSFKNPHAVTAIYKMMTLLLNKLIKINHKEIKHLNVTSNLT